jgi:starch synthase (maltosyl-transferring)
MPTVDGGAFPAKRIINEPVLVEADVFADGHDVIRVVLHHRLVPFGRRDAEWIEVPMALAGNDRWRATFVPDRAGRAEFTVTGWVDHFATWRHALRVKYEAGQAVETELLEGAAMVRATAEAILPVEDQAPDEARALAYERLLTRALEMGAPGPTAARVAAGLSDELAADMTVWRAPVDPVTAGPYAIRVEREHAGFAAWYEMFPRSETPDPSRSATFREAARRLPEIAAMGFDVLYLPPVHPIGRTARKGRNNALTAEPGDPGSPWAIGGEEGGHKAVHPDLGTIDDFAWFVSEASEVGLEVALDLAFQCSPDHPYVREHPEWFRRRPDGTIKHAENPPKKYQDIVALDFECEAWESLWEELKSVVVFWIDHGVRMFRVDNPHTKPFRFWDWLIASVQRVHPDVIFLSEAFTRPRVMERLAKLGFTQSYTYFTWRNTKTELTDYFTELTTTEVREYLRPNLFANTPDILHAYLQAGGRPAFQVRLVLAALLGSLYGIYSGFELAENMPVRPGSEEYLDSEKYQIKPRDWNRPDSLAAVITRLNGIRRTHPACRPGSRLRFHTTDNDELLCFSRETGDGLDRLLVIVNLDPVHMQHGWIDVPAAAWQLPPEYRVTDELTGETYRWFGARSYVRLDPGSRPAHVLSLPAAPGAEP